MCVNAFKYGWILLNWRGVARFHPPLVFCHIAVLRRCVGLVSSSRWQCRHRLHTLFWKQLHESNQVLLCHKGASHFKSCGAEGFFCDFESAKDRRSTRQTDSPPDSGSGSHHTWRLLCSPELFSLRLLSLKQNRNELWPLLVDTVDDSSNKPHPQKLLSDQLKDHVSIDLLWHEECKICEIPCSLKFYVFWKPLITSHKLF